MKLIDGKKIAQEIKDNLKIDVENLKKKNIIPSLAIILVGHDPSSETYVKNKIKAGEYLGVNVNLYQFEENANQEDIINKIEELNNDKKIHGILVQSPLPSKFDEKLIMSKVLPTKDVDGFSETNLGALASNDEKIIAATPLGIIKMLEYENIKIDGKNVVIVGRSKIVGRPLALALLNRNATVCIAHSHTKDLAAITSQADILIVAIGKPKMIKENYVKDESVVIDVGINRIDGKLVGDVDFDQVAPKTSYITPVPGGVGPMTIAMLLNNLITLARKDDING